ncbi:MAG: hypothetical protein KatS3mg102_1917 [Planctomycetota bacterium]|nr:MAG: hypothetical protein KatS3mg102_1917 [Planctomycetota bacterium]
MRNATGDPRGEAERERDQPTAADVEQARRVERALQALRGAHSRAVRLRAAHRLGRELAGQGAASAPDERVHRALAALERLAQDPAEGAWVRKRARRAIRKIRGAESERTDEPPPR